jgi:phosphoribosylformylglycinamidine synthase
MDYEKRVQQAVREMVTAGLVESAHDISDGGLAVAIAECTFGGIGAKIEVDWDVRPELLLFHEGPSRIVVSTRKVEEVKKIATFYGVESPRIGVTMKERLQIRNGPNALIDCSLDSLRQTWDQSLERLLHHENA